MRLGNKKKKKTHLEFQFMFEASLSSQLQNIETLQEYSQEYILYKKKKNTDITLYVIFVKIFTCKNFSRDIKRFWLQVTEVWKSNITLVNGFTGERSETWLLPSTDKGRKQGFVLYAICVGSYWDTV